MGMSRWLDRLFYPDVQGYWDDAMLRARILAHLTPQSRVLDLGAGAGIVPHMNFRGLAAHVSGIDLDPRVTVNPYLDSALIGPADNLPYPDACFDMVFADNVFEHLEDPLAVLKEIKRVLKPGGVFLAKTPNRWHYMCTVARATPLWFHRWFAERHGRAAEDTFPTLYRANSHKRLRRLAYDAGLEVLGVRAYESRPEYLRGLGPLYLLGILYERMVNRAKLLEKFRIILVPEFRRPRAESVPTGLGRAPSDAIERCYVCEGDARDRG
jgi:SAM-dependent methyltransferase